MTTLRIEIASYPEGREDLNVFTTELEVEYTAESATIEDAWWIEWRNGGPRHVPIPVDFAWRLLGGKSELVREYLDRLVEQVLLEGAA